VIGVAEKNLDAEFFENVLRNGFDRGDRADGHKDWGFDLTVGGEQTPGAGSAADGFDLKLAGH